MKNITSLELDMINLVNMERKNRGLKELLPSNLLSHIARLHSIVQMQHKNIFHESPADGSDHAKRIEKGVYLNKSSAENVSTAPTLEINHTGLMNSPGHYKNIVGDWDEIGIGIVKDKDGQMYVTQLFAKPVKLVNTAVLKASILDKLFKLRKSNNLKPVRLVSSNQLQAIAEGNDKKICNKAFTKILNEVRSANIVFSEAKIFQFNGFSNPSSVEQSKLALLSNLKAVSLAFSQNEKTGSLKGVMLFLL